MQQSLVAKRFIAVISMKIKAIIYSQKRLSNYNSLISISWAVSRIQMKQLGDEPWPMSYKAPRRILIAKREKSSSQNRGNNTGGYT